MSENGQHEYPEHPFKGISQAPRTFVYVIGTLTVSVAFLVFTETYIRFIGAIWWQATLTLLGYGIIVANLNFYIIRRLARKLFEGHNWVYVFPFIFTVPWGIWSYMKEDLLGWEWAAIIFVFSIFGLIGAFVAVKKAAIFRADFLERWNEELKRQEDNDAANRQ